MAGGWVKPGSKANPLAGQSEIKHAPIPTNPIAFNFAHLANDQGETLQEWETNGLLSQMLTRFKDHGVKTLAQCFHPKSFKSYGSFPPRSDFKHPKNISPDVVWACMHLTGKICVGGHIVHNIFFVVFLDQKHRFWITELKNT